LVDYLERDLYVYGRGAKVYRRYLKKIRYDRRKGLTQLELMQISPEVKEIIKTVEPHVKDWKEKIAKEKTDLRWAYEARMYLVEWEGWQKIKKYEPEFAAKIPWYINM
jgi:hypothetical protein